MRTVMNAHQMREVDKYMINTLQIPSLVLMENAAMGAARLVMEKKPDPCVVHVFCGTGNNGGDGLACARILLARGYDAYVVIVGDARRLSEDAKSNYAFFEHFPDRVLTVAAIEDLYAWRVPKAEVIVDALFGTGLAREVLGVQADVIASMNSASALRVSIDIPSGIDTDTGRVLGTAVHADCTATFQYPKVGHYLYPGREYTGELRVVPIGIDKGIEDVVDSRMSVYESNDPDIMVPVRNPDSNKGTYGKLLLIAGSRGMAGAAVMCARAAYAAGSGLVTVAAPWAVVDTMQSAVPEATCELLPEEEGMVYSGSIDAILQASDGRSAIAVGPGLGAGRGLKSVISEILTTYDVCRVVDADALNALDKDLKVLAHIRGEVVFTPHPLEFARLLGTEVHSVLEHPLELATAFAQKCHVTLVLKGATTIIANPDGEVTFVAAGSPGMAKGGSGDVLTGTIGGLAAQGVPGYEAAVLGVYLCAMAGEAAASRKGEYSATPEDTIAHLGECIKDCITPDMPAWKVTAREEKPPVPSSAYTHPRRPAPTQQVIRTSAQRTVTEPSVTEKPKADEEHQNASASAPAASTPASATPAAVTKRSIAPEAIEETKDAKRPPEEEKSSGRRTPTDAMSEQPVPAARQVDETPAVTGSTVSAESEMLPALSVDRPERSAAGSPVALHGLSVENNASQEGTATSRGKRMSARDIRPPRISPDVAGRPAAPSKTSTGDTTKVVESLQDTLAAVSKEPSVPVDSTRRQKRSEKKRPESTARQLPSLPVEPAPVTDTDEEHAEARKRAQLNNEIQKELNKKNKGQGRTRRRIG